MRETGRRRPDPSELPRFAPVVDRDTSGGRHRPPRPPRAARARRELDQRLVRVTASISALAVLIVVLLLPPISILDRGSDSAPGGIVARARRLQPVLPSGLEAASALYDLDVPATTAGPATLTVKLSAPAPRATNLLLYSYDGGKWQRLGTAQSVPGGASARGNVAAVPSTIAVLRRVSTTRALGVIVGPGQTPDPAAGKASIVSVEAAYPAPGTTDAGGVIVRPGALAPALRQGGGAVYLGISVTDAEDTQAVDRILADAALTKRHVAAVVTEAKGTGAAGVHLDYGALAPARREAFTAFVQQLASVLTAGGMGLVVSVPTPAGDGTGAYDWVALTSAASALWLNAPSDPSAYYEQVEAALRARAAEGADLERVWLMLDRRSRQRADGKFAALSLRSALTLASALQAIGQGAIAPGAAVSLAGVNIESASGSGGLRWDDRARSVTFEATGGRTVWIENRFSAAFRLDLAVRYVLGGVAVAGAAQDDALPATWETVGSFISNGTVQLELPYGPYLEPRWLASDGVIENFGRGAAVWRAPQQAGTFDVTLIISDGVAFFGQRLSLGVGGGGEPAAPGPTGNR
ncbi:MAG: hypothetical protein EXR65_04105 [Dehalococcoidia bacterium]|nr:hypothetical protein [Dehalococcoidia bacterium]